MSWSTIAERDPDVRKYGSFHLRSNYLIGSSSSTLSQLIVLVDASWDEADEKLFHLCSNDTLRELR